MSEINGLRNLECRVLQALSQQDPDVLRGYQNEGIFRKQAISNIARCVLYAQHQGIEALHNLIDEEKSITNRGAHKALSDCARDHRQDFTVIKNDLTNNGIIADYIRDLPR